MMDDKEILEQVQEILRDIFDIEDLVIGQDTCAGDIEDWDSIAQMEIVLSVERHFQVKFRPDEIAGLQNVGGLMRLIQERQA